MKFWIGLLLIIIGVCVGLYAGVWWAFIGGIINVIEAVRAEQLVEMDVACGVAKIVFSGVIGWLSAIAFIAPGFVMVKD